MALVFFRPRPIDQTVHGPVLSVLLKQKNGPPGVSVGKFKFHRGFVQCLPITDTNLLKHGEELAAVSPLDSIEICGNALDVVRLAASPILLHIRRLAVGMSGMRDHKFATLLGSPHLLNVLAFYAHNNRLGVTACQALRRANLPTFRCLSLYGNPIGDAGLAAIRYSRWFLQLEELRIGECGLSEAAIVALVSDSCCAGVRKLSVGDETHGETAARAVL